ncbi:MAG: FAD-dependent oxidoreductase [Coriobacteriales bacterium]|nr:FAD-dependent oxidoreductase [Coriobacteriales bacterium]
MYEKLFETVTINGMEVPNRLVFEPMGNYYAELNGDASQRDCDFYAARGAGGCGLVITEICSVNRTTGRGDARNLIIDNDEAIPSFRRMAQATQATGAKFAVEIYHPGCQGVPALCEDGMTVSPSGQESKLTHAPTRALEHNEVLAIIDDFIQAGIRVWKSGADAVELHAAHGYLLCQFLSPYTNHRDDEFGGTTEGRAEIMRRIIAGIREGTAPDFPIIVRLTADEYLRCLGIDDGITLPLAVEYCKLFEAWGADAIDVSAGNYETMNWAWEPVGFDEGWKSINGKTIAAAVSIPVIACSVVRHPQTAMDLIEGGVSMVGSARQFFADPCWGKKVRTGHDEQIRPCISCMRCIESLMAAHEDPFTPMVCSVNPEAGRECDLAPLEKDGDGRKVVVVGSGPAGLEAAKVLSRRGFNVVVLERADRVGGQLVFAAKPPKKWRLDWLIEYYMTVLTGAEAAGYGKVELRCGVEATADVIAAEKPVAVIWAAGSEPVKPASIPGLDSEFVLTPPEAIMANPPLTGENVVVVGSGMTGIEVAEMLSSKQDCHVELYEMVEQIGPGIFFQNMIDIMGRLGVTDTGMHPGHKLLEVADKVAVFQTPDGERVEAPFDHLVLSLGMRPNTAPAWTEELGVPVLVAGDSAGVGRIQEAVTGGCDTARSVR